MREITDSFLSLRTIATLSHTRHAYEGGKEVLTATLLGQPEPKGDEGLEACSGYVCFFQKAMGPDFVTVASAKTPHGLLRELMRDLLEIDTKLERLDPNEVALVVAIVGQIGVHVTRDELEALCTEIQAEVKAKKAAATGRRSIRPAPANS